MKISNSSSGITSITLLLLQMLVGSGLASGQTQQKAAPSPNPTAAPSTPEAGAVFQGTETSSAVAEPAPAATTLPVRNSAARSLVRRSTKPVAKEPRTDSLNRGPNPAANPATPAAAQAAGESTVNPVPAEIAGASVPSENYPPDPTPAAASPAPAPESGPPKTTPQPQTEHPELIVASPDYSVVKAVGGFGLVLCLIALAYLGGRRLFPKYFARGAAERSLKLIETLTIGEKRSIAVVEFEDQRLIIGNTPNQITLLAALPLKLSLAEDSTPAPAPAFEFSKSKVASDTFRGLYEIEKTNGRGNRKAIPPDIQAKMRQLRESLEQ